MSPLTPNLFTRRFGDFVEIGRARLRPLAPEWTDHNAHDPGITLMELLAWVGEAQLYSLSHLRRDERAAYAALLGIVPRGTQSAAGLIWPDRGDPDSPVATFSKRIVIAEDAVVHVEGDETPTFRPAGPLLWTPGRISRLHSRLADGRTIEHTRANERGGPAFLPFGEQAGRRDVLTLTFQCRDEDGLFGANRASARGARWAIGVLAAPPIGGTQDAVEASVTRKGGIRKSPLAATFVAGDRRMPARIVSDTTHGLLSTGVLLLDLDGIPISPREFSIELRSTRGFARAPRLLRIEPNVIPIWQGQRVTREAHEANGLPGWSFTLDVPGLRFAAGEEPVVVEVSEPTGLTAWTRCDNLSDRGPQERVFELDAKAARLTFGNGVNGRIPPAGTQVFASYAVSEGDQGRIARNRKWHVAGFAGVFGVNVDPIGGGAAASDWTDDRREARRRSRESHALISADDLAAAALALPLLEVARAWVVRPDSSTPRSGAVTLVVMRSRSSADEPERMPETPRWLEAIRQRLAGRLPLATRLVVSAPRYVDFSIRAKVEATPGRDPIAVKGHVEEQLRKRLALTGAGRGITPRQPGIPVTHRDVAAWIRGAEGVARVLELELLRGGRPVSAITVLKGGLPRWIGSGGAIEAARPAPGRRP